MVAVSFRIFDTDLWQLLVAAKAMVTRREIPHRMLWTWPLYGIPERNLSWGFRLLLWPFWSLGGVMGLFAWRWLTTLAVFAIAWCTARRMGSRGLLAVVAVVMCALVYRQRSQVRPETLAAVLLSFELWILETRRHGGPDRAPWIVAIALAWINVHISYVLGLAVLGAYLVGAWREGGARAARPLLLVFGGAIAASFVNPFGWRGLTGPFEYALTLRNEPLYTTIGELKHLEWSLNLRNGLLVLLPAWPLLQLWRWRRGAFDLVEALVCAGFTAIALTSQRFIGLWAVAAAPFVARDADAWVRAHAWPRWSAAPWARAGLAGAACIALTATEGSRADLPLGLDIDPASYPGPACAFMARAGIRGHGFNYFEHGGYMLYAFWPDATRLPFMTTLPEIATPEMRLGYVRAMIDPEWWREFDHRYGFQYALLKRMHEPGDHLLDYHDADPGYALVFADDNAAIYVRRSGPLAAVAARYAYRWVPGGSARLDSLGQACVRDSAVRAQVRAELERMADASPLHGSACSLLASLLMLDRRWGEARAALERAHQAQPGVPRYHERLGTLALAEGHPREALVAFERERRIGESAAIDLAIGGAHHALGDRTHAREWFRRALRRDPDSQAARDSIDAVDHAAIGS